MQTSTSTVTPQLHEFSFTGLTPTVAADFPSYMAATPAGTRVTLPMLSLRYAISIAKVRTTLLAAFGGRVVFSRGRTGGVTYTK